VVINQEVTTLAMKEEEVEATTIEAAEAEAVVVTKEVEVEAFSALDLKFTMEDLASLCNSFQIISKSVLATNLALFIYIKFKLSQMLTLEKKTKL